MRESLIRRTLFSVVAALFVGTSALAISVGCVEPVFSKTIYVDDDNTIGPWDGTMEHPYQHIQDAVDNASDGDTILVHPGIYCETVTLNKSIALLGSGPTETMVRYENTTANHAAVIEINADNCVIYGFNVSFKVSSQTPTWGVRMDSTCNTIVNNVVLHCTYGIYMYRDAENNTVSHNTVVNNEYGIYLLPGADNNVISSNNVLNNSKYGIRVKGKNNEFFENMISCNNIGVYTCCGSSGNVIYRNTFIQNNLSAKDDRRNLWSCNGVGNYWDDYGGVDLDNDGIGDTPYNISGYGESQDRYPLIFPFVDEEPPDVEIVEPKLGFLYLKNLRIIYLHFFTIVFGSVNVEVSAFAEDSKVSHVEFYVDDEIQGVDSTEPYVWTWSEKTFGGHVIKAVAYDNAGNHVSDEIAVWKFL